MQEYKITKDNTIIEHYRKDVDLIALIGTIYPYSPYNLFWTWIGELLTECFDPEGLNDVMGALMNSLDDSAVEHDYCNEIMFMIQDDRDKYSNYLTLYRISNKIDECGRCFKELRDKKADSVFQYWIEVFSDYSKVIAPYVFDESLNWLKVYMSDIFDDSKSPGAKKRFRKYIGKYKDLIKELYG